MLHNDILVFVEVRARTNTGYINTIETIDRKKVQKIILTSRHYLQRYTGNMELFRFDIVTLTGNTQTPEIDWVKNAFYDE
jgi:putative endonuclease